MLNKVDLLTKEDLKIKVKKFEKKLSKKIIELSTLDKKLIFSNVLSVDPSFTRIMFDTLCV